MIHLCGVAQKRVAGFYKVGNNTLSYSWGLNSLISWLVKINL
jgi:hypothetical protein